MSDEDTGEAHVENVEPAPARKWRSYFRKSRTNSENCHYVYVLIDKESSNHLMTCFVTNELLVEICRSPPTKGCPQKN